MMLLPTEKEEILRKGAFCLGFSKMTSTSGHLTLFILPKDVPQLFISDEKEYGRYRSVFFVYSQTQTFERSRFFLSPYP
jgi:hypothetical protein